MSTQLPGSCDTITVDEEFRAQLGRRNLSPDAAALLRGKLYNSRKLAVPNQTGANQHSEVKRVGLAYRKTASIPGGADPQMQLVFLQEELIPRFEEAREGTRRVFFVDAAHFVLEAFLGMIWCATARGLHGCSCGGDALCVGSFPSGNQTIN